MRRTLANSTPALVAVTVGAIAFGVVVLSARNAFRTLGDPALVTGWTLFALLLFLVVFNLRKRLPMIPLLRARWWTLAHVAGGILALAVFWTHTGSFWPTGAYERFLAGVFYLTSASGLLGHLFSGVYPKRLTETGIEIIYERIPAEIAELRADAETLVTECLRETGHDTLGRYYVETLDWFMRKPRFRFNTLWGGRRGTNWINRHLDSVRRYLGPQEREYLKRLAGILHHKNRVDMHYAIQGVLKGWLLVHLPLAVSLVILALWHTVLVHVYAL